MSLMTNIKALILRYIANLIIKGVKPSTIQEAIEEIAFDMRKYRKPTRRLQ